MVQFLNLKGIVIATAIVDDGKLSLRGKDYPGWSIAIGWVIAMIPIAIIIGCAVAQAYIYKFNWVSLSKSCAL